MASCGYSLLLENPGSCGVSPDYPSQAVYVTLKECEKDVLDHLKFFKISGDGAIDNEMKLILARAGIFEIEKKHESITICPRHRADYGIRWRSSKVTCAVPKDFAAHKSATAKGSKPISSKDAHCILINTGKCVEVGLPEHHN
ncbi:hypothetical protein AC249_AIPGENE6372 [Exaiptasia diaphana]|nr:hypothetical protein AC249_AIPGENE6372 [Exaiptasia diaphana]